MLPSSFFWRLVIGNVVLVAIGLGLSGWAIIRQIDRVYSADTTRQLNSSAESLRLALEEPFRAGAEGRLQEHASRLASINENELRITLIAPDGAVLAETQADPVDMESHADRPEVIEAMRGGRGESERFSTTINAPMRYVAVRVGSSNDPIGIVRVAMRARGLAARTTAVRLLAWTIGSAGLLLTLGLALWLAYFWSRPLAHIAQAARSLSRGDLNTHIAWQTTDELGQLARALNRMRRQISTQLATIERQRAKLADLVRNLTEGVIVARADGRVVLINPAAQRLIAPGSLVAGQSSEEFTDIPLESIVSHPDLLRMLRREAPEAAGQDSGVNRRLAGVTVDEQRMEFDHPNGPVAVLARASDFEFTDPDTDDARDIAARLLVMTDITELARAMQMKTDFVANASHELRTPLSTVRAGIETLAQLDPKTDEPALRQFLTVLDRQCGRLEELVRDLLDLSRIEAPGAQFPVEAVKVLPIVEDLRGRNARLIEERGLEWTVTCPEDCRVLQTSPHLLRLILDNLVDNAVKFTERGAVQVSFERTPSAVKVSVRDTGCGIPVAMRDRVFERFFQVERARTGSAQRGTGLGLAIVKHAVSTLEGALRLESTVGVGTTVTVTLPTTPKLVFAEV